MPQRSRFFAFTSILAALLAISLAVGLRADGEPSQGPMQAASTAVDPPAPEDPWLGLRWAMGDRAAAEQVLYATVAENNAAAAAAARRHPVHVSGPQHSGGGSGTCDAAARHADTATCIGACENGGDYGRSSNPTHFGKYQYDRQTWIAHGGDPDTWGNASPEEQERVFANGTAKYGYGAWTPYDAC